MREPSIDFPLTPPTPAAGRKTITAAELVLRQARKLHRAAQSESISLAMPAVRRVHAAGVFSGRPLSLLFRERQGLKRKHFLRALALEMGFPDWERFRPCLDQMSPEAFEHFKVADEWHVFLNSWFSSEEEARLYAAEHGGRVLRVGTQAVVISPESRCDANAGSAR